jgi:hypothetical protein
MYTEVMRYERASEVKPLVPQSELLHDIGMGEFRVGNETLHSLAASTCIILAAHNSDSGYGLMGHFSSISEAEGYNDRAMFEDSLLGIASIGEADTTSVWIGGGSPFENFFETDSVKSDRDFAEEKLKAFAANFRLPADQVCIAWSEPFRIVDAELDCPSGVLVVHDYPNVIIRAVHDAVATVLADVPHHKA